MSAQPSFVPALLDLATHAETREELRAEVLERLARWLGFDTLIAFDTGPQPAATVRGFDPRFWRLTCEHRERFDADLGRLLAAVMQSGGAGVDSAMLCA